MQNAQEKIPLHMVPSPEVVRKIHTTVGEVVAVQPLMNCVDEASTLLMMKLPSLP
jgi:hypothetical protein